MNEYRIGTKCVQGGYTPGNGEPRQIPIYQSTTYKYDTSQDIFIPDCRIRLMIWLRQRLQRWKVERQRC